MKGPLLGTDPTIDKEDAQLQKMLEGSICRGCWGKPGRTRTLSAQQSCSRSSSMS